MRLAELLGTLSLASDAGMGMPMEHGLRAAAASARLGELAGARASERADAFYLMLLRYVGCTADSNVAAEIMGDEIAVRSALYGIDFGAPTEFLFGMLREVTRGKGPWKGAARALTTMSKLPKLMETGKAHCEVGERLAARFGFGEPFRAAMLQTFERWDGGGFPKKLKGEKIALSMRLAQIGEDIELGHRLGGVEGARALLKKRARKGAIRGSRSASTTRRKRSAPCSTYLRRGMPRSMPSPGLIAPSTMTASTRC